MPCPYEALRLREFEEIEDLESIEKGRSMTGKNARPPPDYLYYYGGLTFLSGVICGTSPIGMQKQVPRLPLFASSYPRA